MTNSIANSPTKRNRSRAVAALQSADRMRRSAKRLGGDRCSLAPGAREPGRVSGMPRPLAGLRRLEPDCAYGAGSVPEAWLRFDAVSRSMPVVELEKAAASGASAEMTVRSFGECSDRQRAEFANG